MFYPLAGKLIPWFAIPAALLFATGLFVGFFIAPTDFQQGDARAQAVRRGGTSGWGGGAGAVSWISLRTGPRRGRAIRAQ